MSHEAFLSLPRTRVLRRKSPAGDRLYYVWDGRSRGLGEVIIGRDPVEALRLHGLYERGELTEAPKTPHRLASNRRRHRRDGDPFLNLPLWARTLFNAAETRCRDGRRVFALTAAEFGAIVHRCGGRCEVSGVPLSHQRRGGRLLNPFAPSIDRISSADGYTADNVRIVCVMVNFAMNQWGEEPLRTLVEHMSRAQKSGTSCGTDG